MPFCHRASVNVKRGLMVFIIATRVWNVGEGDAHDEFIFCTQAR